MTFIFTRIQHNEESIKMLIKKIMGNHLSVFIHIQFDSIIGINFIYLYIFV